MVDELEHSPAPPSRLVEAGNHQTSEPIGEFVQDPYEVLDYSVDWAAVLEAEEVIAESIWMVESGDASIGVDGYAASNGDSSTTVWLSGGTESGSCGGVTVTNRITTDNTPPRIYERSILILIRNK